MCSQDCREAEEGGGKHVVGAGIRSAGGAVEEQREVCTVEKNSPVPEITLHIRPRTAPQVPSSPRRGAHGGVSSNRSSIRVPLAAT